MTKDLPLITSTLISGEMLTFGLSQKEVAQKLEISQPKVSILISGPLSSFSTDTLLHYLSILGCDVQIRVRKPRSRVGIFRHKWCISVR